MKDAEAYKNFIVANEMLAEAKIPTENRWGYDQYGSPRQFTDERGRSLSDSQVCFECGGKLIKPFVSQEVYHEKDSTEKMTISAHLACAKSSVNNWEGASTA